MNTEADKTALKNTLTSLELGDWTDIGLGLNRAAINEAKAQNFPVYNIGLNADGTVDENQLKLISSETNGEQAPSH